MISLAKFPLPVSLFYLFSVFMFLMVKIVAKTNGAQVPKKEEEGGGGLVGVEVVVVVVVVAVGGEVGGELTERSSNPCVTS